MAKKEKVVYKEKVNWKKEAALLPGLLCHDFIDARDVIQVRKM